MLPRYTLKSQNDSSKPVYVGTKSRVYLSIDLPVKNIVFTTNIHYFWKSTDFEGVFCKSLVNIFIRNSLHKKSGGPIFTKYIALSDFKRLRLSSERWNKKPNKLLQDKMKSSVRKSWDTLMNVRLLIVRLVCLHHSSQLQISRRRICYDFVIRLPGTV